MGRKQRFLRVEVDLHPFGRGDAEQREGTRHILPRQNLPTILLQKPTSKEWIG